MPKNKKQKSALLTGLVIIAATFLLFIINVQEIHKIDLISFAFILLSEISVLAGVIILAGKEKHTAQADYRTAIYSVLCLYLVIAVFISSYFMMGYGNGVARLIVIQAAVAAVAYVVVSLLDLMAKSNLKSSKGAIEAGENIRSIVNKAEFLSDAYKKSPYGKILKELYETINYVDFSYKNQTDIIIAEELSTLEVLLSEDSENKYEAVEDSVKNILSLIKQRETMGKDHPV